jgi:hypothetical protein
MPPLTDPRHEAFAQACAKGSNRKAAYVGAGFAPDRSKGSEMARRPAVAARIAELEWLRDRALRAELPHMIADLMDNAFAGEAMKSAAGLKEARLARLEASRLLDRMEREAPRPPMPHDKELTLAEWMVLYGAPAPG